MSRAEAKRWLASHVGAAIETVQVRASDGATWRPAVRTLTQEGTRFVLDGSRIALTSNHHVTGIDATSLSLTWFDADESPIHTTTYRVVETS